MADPTSIPAELLALRAELEQARDEKRHLAARLSILEQALAAAPVGISVYDRELRYLVFNAEMERTTQRRAEAVLGRRIESVFPFLREAGVIPAQEHALAGEARVLPRRPYDDPVSQRRGWTYSTHTPVRDSVGTVVGVLSTVVDVTQQVLAEQHLEQASRENQRLLDNLTALVIRIDANGRVTYANDYALERLGFAADELLGRPIEATILEPGTRGRDGRDLGIAIRETPESLQYGVNEVRTRDGSRRWISWASRVVEDPEGDTRELLAVGLDITEQRLAREALLLQERRFQGLYQHMTEGVALHSTVLDAEGRLVNYRILDVNPRFLEILGVAREEVVGKLATEAYGTTPPLYLDEFGAVALSGEARRLETCFTPLNRWFELSVAPLGEGGFATIFSDITERKRQETELRKRTAELDGFFSLSLDLLCLADAEGRFVRLSPAWGRTLGYEADELLGRSYIDLVHPEDREATAFATATLAEGGTVIDFANRYRHRDGSWRWLQWRSAGEPGGLIYAVARDVTCQREEEERLQRSEADLRRSQAVARLGSYRLELPTMTWSHSAVLDEILGIEPDAPASREDVDSLVHPEDREALRAQFEGLALAGRGPLHHECRLRGARDGAERWVHILGELERGADGAVQAVFGTVQDITERKRAEDEHRKLAARVQHAQKLESLGVLAGGIAHDFNNLLTSMLGNADLALEDLPRSSPARGNVEDIETAARRAAELCRQLLAYSGRGRFQVQIVDLRDVIEEMGQLLSVTVSKQVVLRYHFAADLPGVEADPTQIRQVVMNLITNASEAIGDKQGVISVSTGAMTCDESYLGEAWSSAELEPGLYACLEVTDTGCGMDASTQQRLFDPFFSTKFTGRGLGLAAAIGIVRGHRGAIKVYSELGRGSCFKLLFPAAGSPAHPLRAQAVRERWQGRGKVLLVDDEVTVRSVGRAILERAGLTVLTAEDGEQALQVFRSEPEIACVILDLTMPRMDGETCFRELRRLRPDVRVVLTSGYNEQEVVSRFTGKGLAGFVQKPYKAAELLACIQQLLRPTPRPGGDESED